MLVQRRGCLCGCEGLQRVQVGYDYSLGYIEWTTSRSDFDDIRARFLALFDCSVPMKCHRMSGKDRSYDHDSPKVRKEEEKIASTKSETHLLCLLLQFLHVILTKIQLSVLVTRRYVRCRFDFRYSHQRRPLVARRARSLHA